MTGQRREGAGEERLPDSNFRTQLLTKREAAASKGKAICVMSRF